MLRKASFPIQILAALAVPAFGYLVGYKLDMMEDERLARFRDKSMLYGKATPPEQPSW